MVKYPEIRVRLAGEDGNIFFIMGRVSSAMKRAGIPQGEREAFCREVTQTKSYDDALQCVMRYVNTL